MDYIKIDEPWAMGERLLVYNPAAMGEVLWVYRPEVTITESLNSKN